MATEVTATKQETETKTQGDQKGHLQSGQRYQCILEISVNPRELECMKERTDITAKHPGNIMTAKNTMGIGVYTGFSLLPDDGKIEVREGPAMPVLDQIEDKKYHGSYCFIFVVADKDNYINYHKRLIELLKVGSVVVAPPDVSPRKEPDAPLRKEPDVPLLRKEPDGPLWKYGRYFTDLVLGPDAPLRKYLRYSTEFLLELNRAFAAVSMIKRVFGF